MRIRGTILAAALATVLIPGFATAAPGRAPNQEPPQGAVDGVARDLRLSPHQARERLVQQADADRIAAALPSPPAIAGRWFRRGDGQARRGRHRRSHRRPSAGPRRAANLGPAGQNRAGSAELGRSRTGRWSRRRGHRPGRRPRFERRRGSSHSGSRGCPNEQFPFVVG